MVNWQELYASCIDENSQSSMPARNSQNSMLTRIAIVLYLRE